MKVAVVTPHHDSRRGIFLEQLKKYMAAQTRQPDEWIVVDQSVYAGKIGVKDLTKRVRIGCTMAKERGCDVVLIMEDDDWYDPNYIEFMVHNWHRCGKPELFGIGYTLYFHISGKYWHSPHAGRASLMSTLIRLDALDKFKWCDDSYIWLDIALWQQLKGKTIEPVKHYSVGIKHGIGDTGGVGHNKGFSKYQPDITWQQLRRHLPANDIQFYKTLCTPQLS